MNRCKDPASLVGTPLVCIGSPVVHVVSRQLLVEDVLCLPCTLDDIQPEYRFTIARGPLISLMYFHLQEIDHFDTRLRSYSTYRLSMHSKKAH